MKLFLKKEIHFRSRYSFLFYFFAGFFFLVCCFALYRLVTGDLDLPGFIFLVLVSFLPGYIFSFRFDCRVTLDSKHLKLRYIIPFRQPVLIEIGQIVEIDKHEDAMKRYHKKIFIVTPAKNYLVRYNISDGSDAALLEILHQIISG